MDRGPDQDRPRQDRSGGRPNRGRDGDGRREERRPDDRRGDGPRGPGGRPPFDRRGGPPADRRRDDRPFGNRPTGEGRGGYGERGGRPSGGDRRDRPPYDRPDRGPRGGRGFEERRDRPAGGRGDRPGYTDRPRYDDRPAFGDRGRAGGRDGGDRDRAERPRYDDRPRFQGRDDRPRGEDRPRYGDRGDRPRYEDRPRFDDRGDRPRFDRGGRPPAADRPPRRYDDDRGPRFRDDERGRPGGFQGGRRDQGRPGGQPPRTWEERDDRPSRPRSDIGGAGRGDRPPFRDSLRPGGSPWARPGGPERGERDRPNDRPRERRSEPPGRPVRPERPEGRRPQSRPPRRPDVPTAAPDELDELESELTLRGPEADAVERDVLADDAALDELELAEGEDELEEEAKAEAEEEEDDAEDEGEEDEELEEGEEPEDELDEEDEEDGQEPEADEAEEAGEDEAEDESRSTAASEVLTREPDAEAEAGVDGPSEARQVERRPEAPPSSYRAFTVGRLRGRLLDIDGQSYRAYREIEGEYRLEQFILAVDHVQPDPFAPPSRLRVRVPMEVAGIPSRLFDSPVREIALRDYLVRRFAAAIERHVRGQRGTGESGRIRIASTSQEILERSSCVVTPEHVEVRFTAALPSDGRVVLGRQALAMLLDELPLVVHDSLLYSSLGGGVHRHIAVAEDQEALRAQLADRRLVAFVADGSVLPRASGVSQRPLEGSGVVPFESPPELRVELETPNRGKVSGMGIPVGVTLIVGGGFHGKSTLLEALERGVYNHVPGDGREYVVTRSDAVKIRAEDGRAVERVDISAFVGDLPFGKDTESFTTDNASGSTSQASNIMEALEVGTYLLLLDEDTSAGNFMLRDSRMQRLIPKADEPITPFVDQVRALYDDHGISTILAMGGSGDYLDVADTVIAMRAYVPRPVTAEAREVASALPTQRVREVRGQLRAIMKRSAVPESIDPSRRGRDRVQARGLQALEFGETRVDLSALDQLVDVGQTRAIGDLIAYCLRRGFFDGDAPMVEALGRGLADADARGLEVFAAFRSESGDYARPRLHEAAGALNRLRGLRAKQVGG